MDVAEFASFQFDYVGGGPVQGYPLNEGVFSNQNPRTIKSGQTVAVPWSKNKLRHYCETVLATKALLIQTTKDLENEVDDAYTTLGRWCFGCDLVAALTGLAAGPAIGKLQTAGKVAAVPTAFIKCSTSVQAAGKSQILSNSLIAAMKMVGGGAGAVEFSAGSLSYALGLISVDPSQSNLTFTIRHAFGFWSPSYWASVYDVVVNGEDLDVWLYGPGAAQRAFRQKLQDDMQAACRRLNERIQAARAQASAPFWNNQLNVNRAANLQVKGLRTQMRR